MLEMLSGRSKRPLSRTRLLLALLVVASAGVSAQPSSRSTNFASGTVEMVEVFGPSLEGNLEGDDPNRDVFVYLPPSYAAEPARRYPVVYFLHGYASSAENYVRSLHLPGTANSAFGRGIREMIIVLPDANTIYNGSMFSNSPTTGDWELFVSRDLVSYIDQHYRTIPERPSRGLAGHSMGGYGTMRIGMKQPQKFAALYAMSSCCLLIDPSRGGDDVLRARDLRNAGQGAAPPAEGPFAKALSAQAAAWAPNPNNPPDYFDLPFRNGELQPLINAKWLANAPLVMVDQYVPSLQTYRAIALDVGNADPLRADNMNLDAALSRLGVPHTFEQYEGDHGNRMRQRFELEVLPFFSQHLDFGQE